MTITSKQIALFFVIIGLFMTFIGGWLDFKQEKYRISQRHFWNDGTYITILAIFILLYFQKI